MSTPDSASSHDPICPAPAPGRAARADGHHTRAQIIETAGHLFAELGYEGTTSKQICTRCCCNTAAVNYHFGGRAELYSTVLVEAHRRLIGLNTLLDIHQAHIDPREKLSRMLESLLDGLDPAQWHARLFIRELMSPSPLIDAMIQEEALPKFAVIRAVLTELTGIGPDDPRMARCLLSTISPCVMLLVGDRQTMRRVLGDVLEDREALKEHLTTFLFAGLAAIASESPSRGIGQAQNESARMPGSGPQHP